MIHAVIDTNVLVSAFLSRNGNEAGVLRLIRAGLVTPCMTEEMIGEYIEVLSRPKFGFQKHEADNLIALLRSKGLIVLPREIEAVSPDATDTKFLQCAFAASADFLVTGNRRHFPASPYGSTYVVNAGELLARVTPDPPLST